MEGEGKTVEKVAIPLKWGVSFVGKVEEGKQRLLRCEGTEQMGCMETCCAWGYGTICALSAVDPGHCGGTQVNSRRVIDSLKMQNASGLDSRLVNRGNIESRLCFHRRIGKEILCRN